MWDLNSWTRDLTCVPSIGRQTVNHWTTREIPEKIFNEPRCLHLSSVGKESACNTGDPSLIPGSGRSAGEGKGYPLQYSGLENSMDYSPCVCGRAKLLQLCLTLFNPMDCSPPGFSVRGILQGIFSTQGWSMRLLPLLHWQADC